MISEDFSEFSEKKPGCFFLLGCGVDNDKNVIYSHHDPKFRVNEKCLAAGVQIFVNLLEKLLGPAAHIQPLTKT